jgi:hypothetical protein
MKRSKSTQIRRSRLKRRESERETSSYLDLMQREEKSRQINLKSELHKS